MIRIKEILRAAKPIVGVLAIALAVAWFAGPTHAGDWKSNGSTEKKTETSPERAGPTTKSASTSDVTDDSLTESFDGEINPTNVPIVTSDFLDFSITPEDLLVTYETSTKFTGAGVVVAVLDGGFAPPSEAMAPQMSTNAYDAVDDDDDPYHRRPDLEAGGSDDWIAASPGLGHGTFVADMVLKVAPAATILPIRVADDSGRVKSEWIERGINHAIENGVDVINLSLVMNELSKASYRSLRHASSVQGILIVVAAGNDGSSATWGALADSSFTMAVGAVDNKNCIADFSNYAERWSENIVFAPGVNLVGTRGFPERDTQCVWSGTSFATGLVSGAVALKMHQSEDMMAMFVADAIRATLDPVYTPSGVRIEGAGVINLERLMKYVW